MENIDKAKFELIDNNNYLIDTYDFSGKPVSFFRDGLNRFKKNKSSVVAFIIISILLFFILVGPFMRNYQFVVEEPGMAPVFDYLPARVRFLENVGILNGRSVISNRPASYLNNLPQGIVVRRFNRRVEAGVEIMDAEVNYYLYREHILRETVQSNWSHERVQLALDRGALIEIVNINPNNTYDVRIDWFVFAFGETADNVYFWFGTDMVGADLFTVLFTGARVSMVLAIAVTLINIVIGILIGSVIGYYGGKADIIFERVVDVLAGIPFLTVITLLILAMGNSVGIIILAFCATGWIGAYSTTRIQTYRFKNREFVLAARTYGASDTRIIFKHILPNAMGFLITAFALAIPAFLLTEATFSFLGIIEYRNVTGIGQLLAQGQAVMPRHGHLVLFPALFIALMMLMFNLFSNGLRDAFNPSLRGVEE